MGEIVIEKMKYKEFIAVLINLLFLIAAIVFSAYGFNEKRALFYLLGIIVSIALLISSIGAIIHAMQIKILLTITHEGIIDNSTISGVGYLSFNEIKEFVILTINYKKCIAVIPNNIDDFLSQLSVVKRTLVRRNINSNLPPVMIPADLAKDMEPEDILSLLKKRLTDYTSLYE